MIKNRIIIQIIYVLGSLLFINFITIKVCANNQDTTSLNTHDKALFSEIFGGVSSVKGEILEKSPAANLSQTLAGRLPGLYTYETNSTLAHSTTRLNIRGVSRNSIEFPAVVIDGILFTYNTEELLRNYILPEEIESISILKDASSQAIYGGYGSNGIIVITTKQGKIGPLKVKTRIDHSFQQTITRPSFISSAEYAELRNQAAFNDGMGSDYYFLNSDIENFASGDNDLYPNNNWYNRFMKDYALMQRALINFTGGSEAVRYFTNVS
ncbi:MAG: TonB-dependent receptor plug domain-containing protein, partial [Mariniphaga sp.]|nr:TonB-dependent receptor plug domain-containing protein [Mariniphaga sp.]